MATVFGNEKNFRTQKVLAAAKFGKTNVSVSGKDATSDKNPFGITPALNSGKKTVVGSNAAMWEVCGESLRGQTKEHQGEVIGWLEVSESSFLPAVLGWVLPSISVVQHDKKALDGSKGDLETLLGVLDKYLLTRTFLVGDRLSIADISLAFNLSPAFTNVLDSAARKNFVNVTRWYCTVMNQLECTQVAGAPALCDKAAQFDAKKFKEYQSAAGDAPEDAGTSESELGGKKKKGKKEKGGGKKKEAKKEEKAPEEEMDAAEAALAEEPKKKDPFDQFPKGNWNMDEFKREYSNKDTETEALPYFWNHFEPDNYSIWYCEYKYNKELALVFMTCNLVSGMFQRLDKMRKNSFGSMCIFGENNNNSISGVWFWKGHELAFELSQDWQIDYESYDWKKLDPKDPKTKKMVKEYFCWEGDFDGKKFNQGKIFK